MANKITDGKEGYEPVAYFGGSPYNFDVYNYEYFGNERGWEEAKFVFFRPSETYTSGTEYISGLFFVSGHDVTNSAYIKRSWKLTEYAERLGGKLLGDADLTKDKTWFRRGVTGRARNVSTYLCYTTTFNPKRAIYDVQFYAGTPRMENFVTTLTAYTGNKESNFAQTGYGIVPVFMQYYDKMAAFEYSHYELNNYEDFTVGSGESRSCCDHQHERRRTGI